MIKPFRHCSRRVPALTYLQRVPIALVAGLMLGLVGDARAEWVRDDVQLGWRRDGHDFWRYSFDPAKGKPFFHPLSAGGPSLTNFKPDDHPWHYGLWFSWKYINRVNYWEEDRKTGKAEGATQWSAPIIDVHPDGRANIRMEISYRHPSGRVDLTEQRELVISAPARDGSYIIDWRARFVAGAEGALLDRTPMPGEPDGQINGGYAALSIRLANAPLAIAFISTHGPVTEFTRDRARPNAPAIACNFTDGGRDAGGVAILSDAGNAGENPPWYLINSTRMRFACAAVLAPKPRMIQPHGEFDLRFRIAVQRATWTAAGLENLLKDWKTTRTAMVPPGRN